MHRNKISRFLYAVPCAAIIWTVWTLLGSTYYEEEYFRRRGRILSEEDPEDCIPSGIDAFPPDFLTQEQRRNGGVVAHFLILFYVCAMTAVVCDDYFVPALEAIASKLNLSPDVAGATFMAIGASAPELFSSIAGSFITEGDIGIGTIMGSAVFNMLAISGIIGLVTGNKVLSIEWYPVLRDSIVYAITVIIFTIIISDNIVTWWESLILLIIFALYIFLMNFNRQVERTIMNTIGTFRLDTCCKNSDSEKKPLLDDENKIFKNEVANSDIEKKCGLYEQTEDDTAEKRFYLRMWHVFMYVPSILFRFTIPPVRFYPGTFLMSIVWMGALSYLAVWMVTVIGYTLYVPDAASGLTLLAAGSSVPDLVATVIIAKSGEGNMAMSNLLGSNTFDLAFCLGAPWFVKSVISKNGQLQVYSSAMVYTAYTLLLTLFALLLIFQLNKWKLSRVVGFLFLGLYLISITLACLYEMNVFGEINKPTCF